MSIMVKHEFKIFGCFHVSTVASLVGLWHLAIHLLGFCIFISAYYLLPDYCDESFYAANDEISHVNREKLHHANVKLWIFTSLFSFMATVVFIYGNLSKKSIFVVPFLSLQLLDLIFDFLVLGTYICLSSNINDFVSQLRQPPFQRFLVRYGEHYKTLFVLTFVIISFTMKVYLAKIVFLCYRFLMTWEMSTCKHNSILNIRTDEAFSCNKNQKRTKIYI